MGLSMRSLVVAVVVLATVLPFATALLSPDANSPQAFLTPHNDARRKVGVAALQWDNNLAAYARNYAKSQKSKCVPLKHSAGPYGENLFWGSGKAWTPKEAVTFWVQEQSNYQYSTNKCLPGKMCGHYTQVVWKSTTHVGCASVECSDKSVYIICSYNPPGNWVGQRPY